MAPNVEEAEGAVGHEFNDADDLALGLTGLLEMGAREAIITRPRAASRSCPTTAPAHRYEVEIEPLDPVSGVGSGDCFLAGYVAAALRGRVGPRVAGLRRRLRRGVDAALRRRQL